MQLRDTLPLLLLLAPACQVAPRAHPQLDPAEVATEVATRALDLAPIARCGRAVTGASPEAQRWFDQGLSYYFGFNHDQAAACFARATLASPGCAMAWWGLAQAYSLDLNSHSVSPEEAARSAAAMGRALELLAGATPVEQTLIEAAALRCVAPQTAYSESKEIHEAYSEALERAWARFPDDADVGVLYAEALMILQPWNYWTPDDAPVERAEELVAVLEAAQALSPDHIGANHFYIHAMEASATPERAEGPADRLGAATPGSGHLTHMPSHIYVLTGRYEDAVDVNLHAAELDEAYFEAYGRDTFYLVYYVHNLHFAGYGAMMEGRKQLALECMDRMDAAVPAEMIEGMLPAMDGWMAARLHVMVRFGMWEELLAMPEFGETRLVSRALHRYARTVALANLGRVPEAEAEYELLEAACERAPEDWEIGFNPCRDVLALAKLVARAELHWRAGRPAEALPLLEEGARLEHVLIYTEPPAWVLPVRHTLGAIQLASGDAAAAERTYREDLARNRENPWSLVGLHHSLLAQGREEYGLEARVEAAWSRAAVRPGASCYCGLPVVE